MRSTYGFCVPQSCKSENLQELFDIIEDFAESPLHFSFSQNECSDETLILTNSAKTALYYIFFPNLK